jgi:hypothetical protein
MQKLFEIRIELIYIAFFRAIGWLLSRYEVEIVWRQLAFVLAKYFPQPAAVAVTLHGVAVFGADREAKPRPPPFVLRIKKNPVPRNPFLGILTQPEKVRSLSETIRRG